MLRWRRICSLLLATIFSNTCTVQAAPALLPLDFQQAPTFPIFVPLHHGRLLPYIVKNNTAGTLPLVISLTPSPYFTLDKGTCGASLAGQESCQLQVFFAAPNNTLDKTVDELTIDYQGRAPLSSSMLAKVIAPGSLIFTSEPTSPIVVQEKQTQVITFTIKNDSTAPLTHIQPSVTPGLPELAIDSDPQITTCPSTLPAGQSCQIGVLLRAPAAPQNTDAMLLVKYDQSDALLTSQFHFQVMVTPGPLAVGYNLSGFEFSTVATPSLYPNANDATLFVKTAGATVIRLPFRMEYFADQNGNLTTQSYLDAVNGYAQTLLGMNPQIKILLDLHNYMRYCPNQQAGSCNTFLTPTQVNTVWQTISNHMSVVKQYPQNVVLDLMNEPNGIPAQDTFNDEMAAFLGLRQAGVTNTVVLEGTAWSGLHSWDSSGNSAVFTPTNINNYFTNHGGTTDQVGSDAIEVHQYLDDTAGFSGTTPFCVDTANMLSAINFGAFTTWLQSNPIPIILGETGGGNNQTCTADLQAFYEAMLNDPYVGQTKQNSLKDPTKRVATNVEGRTPNASGGFTMLTYWGGGQAWGNSYLFGIEPISSANTAGFTATYAPSQLYVSLGQLGTTSQMPPLYTTVPTTQYNYGVCNSALFTIDIQNDLNLYVSTGNIQFGYAGGSGPVNAPMSFAIPNDPWQYQQETVCLPLTSNVLYAYPAPTYQQVKYTITPTPSTQVIKIKT